MKKWLLLAALALPLFVSTGCEPFETEDDEGVTEFFNKSNLRVIVIPESQGWSGFALKPGERKKVYDVYDLYFSFEPRFRVKVGDNDGGRVVFVNGDPNAVQVSD